MLDLFKKFALFWREDSKHKSLHEQGYNFNFGLKSIFLVQNVENQKFEFGY